MKLIKKGTFKSAIIFFDIHSKSYIAVIGKRKSRMISTLQACIDWVKQVIRFRKAIRTDVSSHYGELLRNLNKAIQAISGALR